MDPYSVLKAHLECVHLLTDLFGTDYDQTP